MLRDRLTMGVVVGTFSSLFAWGDAAASTGQLGNLEDGTRFSPVQAGTLTNWSSVSAGSHSLGIKTDGTLWAWGLGTTGQLGQVTVAVSRSSPAQVGTLTNWASVSAGISHSLAIQANGTLWGWGAGTVGQLGQVTAIVNRSSPVQIGTLTGWSVANVGGLFSLAIRTNGSLWAWGTGTAGELGQVTAIVNRSSPTQIGTLTSWSFVTGGTAYSLATRTDGTLWAWGTGTTGQLGQVTAAVNRSSPTQIGTLTSWSVATAGSLHSLARKTDGTLWAWGSSATGQLGEVTGIVNRSSPVQIGTLTAWSSVLAGTNFVTARKTDGTLWAWGQATTAGQVGDSTKDNRSSPVQIGTLTAWSTFSSGSSHVVAVQTDGTLWGWGSMTSGQLGNLEDGTRVLPIPVGNTDYWDSITSSGSFSLARKTDGTLWAWGLGTSGQLGQVTAIVSRSSPTQIGTLTNWSVVGLGTDHSISVRTDGTLWAWGLGTSGQLGQVTVIVNRSSPIQIGTLTGWAKGVGGFAHSFAIKTNGTLWAWGSGTSSQIGDSGKVNRSSPVQIGTLTNWSSVTASPSVSFALKTDSTLWVWGSDTTIGNGHLGNLEDRTRFSPVQAGSSNDWASVSCSGGTHSLATKTNGTLWAWGLGTTGQLGQVTAIVNQSSPVQIGTLTNWGVIGTGALNSVSLKTDGTLWGWGGGTVGQLGQVTAIVNLSSPVQIGTLTGWNKVSSGGGSHFLAVRTNGTLWAWGLGTTGQLGQVTAAVNRSSPTQIGTLTSWSAVAGGATHSLALKTDNTLWAWGLGTTGQLGQVTAIINRSSPTQIGTLTSWSAVAGGTSHSLALRANGTLWGWGAGTVGQLGQVTAIINRSSPTQIGTLTSWSAVAGGANHSLALKTDGTLWAWGTNGSGELGDSAKLNRSSPVQIGTLTSWATISGSVSHSLATKTDGTVWAWGWTNNGQLGNLEDATRFSPVQIGGTEWLSVSTNSNGCHSLAIKTDNTLWAWGTGGSGQLGETTVSVNRSSPIQIGTLTSWVIVKAGSSHSLAIRANGTLWAWGLNSGGMLGSGTKSNSNSPVQVGTLTSWTAIAAGSSHSLGISTS